VFVRASDLVNPKTTRDDWVVTHELFHVNFPDLGREHAWLSEGLATYLEPVARARVGLVDDDKFWRDLVQGLPQGLPQAGDRGLENTHTWGRTYWGGALYCLVADVTIRERTGNTRSLDDVIRAIGKTGETDDIHWSTHQFLEAGRDATGTSVLSELFAQLADQPGTVSLSELFARLGVTVHGESVVFDDAAPLARIRRAITAH
jgi:predicted metalloprotease with PDZ domain